jgi:integration host factor subunit beta
LLYGLSHGFSTAVPNGWALGSVSDVLDTATLRCVPYWVAVSRGISGRYGNLAGRTLLGTITKRDLAQVVARSTGTKSDLALETVDGLFGIMREELISGNRIEVRGFGVLETRDTKAKPGARNPRTDEIVYVPARRKAHFRPGKVLKEALCQPLPAER